MTLEDGLQKASWALRHLDGDAEAIMYADIIDMVLADMPRLRVDLQLVANVYLREAPLFQKIALRIKQK